MKKIFVLIFGCIISGSAHSAQEPTVYKCMLSDLRARGTTTQGAVLAIQDNTETEVLGLVPMVGSGSENLMGLVYLFQKSSDGATRVLFEIVRNGEILVGKTLTIDQLTSYFLINTEIGDGFFGRIYLGCKKL